MAYMSNRGKGRIAELYKRVKNNEPANSAFILVPLSKAGTEAQGQDLDSLKDVLLDEHFAEQKEGGWKRITLDDSTLATYPEPNDAENRNDMPNPTVKYGTIEKGKNVVGIAVCYDSDTTSGTDENIEFIGFSDWEITADGSEVTLKEGQLSRSS